MIVCRLQGGLGNQMFQYAACRALAIAKSQPLYLDISFFGLKHEGITSRSFKLDGFNIIADIANKEILTKFAEKPLNRVLNKLIPYYKKKCYSHPDFRYDRNFYKTGNNILLNGYWQSYLYFQKINEIIINDLTLKDQHKTGIGPQLSLINSSQSVSVHIRRGDYVTNKIAADVLGCLPAGYYEQAVQLIRGRVKEPLFFIFSDDPEWVKSNMRIPNATVIESNNELHDLILMSHCKHNIIANSSFSWWAAWLNKNINKIVIAPHKWFNDPLINTDDLIPPTWIRL